MSSIASKESTLIQLQLHGLKWQAKCSSVLECNLIKALALQQHQHKQLQYIALQTACGSAAQYCMGCMGADCASSAPYPELLALHSLSCMLTSTVNTSDVSM